MQPLTRERLARSAYRTLGVSASATRAQVSSAARRMRIRPDPQQIPPTPWDLPPLGPPPRTRIDIEQAVSLIQEPASRIEERLIWYLTLDPSITQLRDFRSSNLSPGPAYSPAAWHDAALAALHFASSNDPGITDVDFWTRLSTSIRDLSRSKEFAESLERAEKESDFEKRAAPVEIRSSIAALPSALAEALVLKAQGAGIPTERETCNRIVSLLRSCWDPQDASKLVNRVFDSWEDKLQSLCGQLDRELRDKLRTNHDAPAPFYHANHQASQAGADFYNSKIDPLLQAITSLANEQEERKARLRTAAAEVLPLLALGWEWAAQFVVAEGTLQLALRLADGTQSAAEIQTRLEKCRPLAEKERLGAQAVEKEKAIEAPAPKAERSPSISAKIRTLSWNYYRSHRWKVISVGAFSVLVVILMIVQNQTPNASPATPSAPVPTFTLAQISETNAKTWFGWGEFYYNGHGVSRDFVQAMKWYRNAADAGNVAAMTKIGEMYLAGEGVEKDAAAAAIWFQKAVDRLDDPTAMYRLGQMCHEGNGVAKDDSKAMDWFRKSSTAGNASAMVMVGLFYGEGISVSRDYGEAMSWYRSAAEKGEPTGMYDVGVLYRDGSGVPKNYQEAMSWFHKAADNGYSGAFAEIGLLYAEGHGVPKDAAQAETWFQKGVAAGDVPAMGQLGHAYAQGDGVAQDYQRAAELFQKSADGGDTFGMKSLAYLYANGKGVERDYVQAMEWYLKAANAGDASAMWHVGGLLEDGLGVAQDYTQAMEWYDKAASAGDADAKNSIGEMYRHGYGVNQDYAEALRWYQKAATAGSDAALTNIGEFYRSGKGVPRDFATALTWLRKAADAGRWAAMRDLADMYTNGQGVPQDDAEARRWYKKAADAGDEESKRWLAEHSTAQN